MKKKIKYINAHNVFQQFQQLKYINAKNAKIYIVINV